MLTVRCAWPTAAVLLATFGLTLVRDLTSGIVAGCVLAALFALILRRAVPEEGDGEEAGG